MRAKPTLRRRQSKRIWLVALALGQLLPVAPVWAHDFWLEPTKFRTNVGDDVGLKLLVGQDFGGNAVLYNPEYFERYLHLSRGGEQPVAGTLGDDPAGHVHVGGPGLHSVGFYSKKFEVTFDNIQEFELYLKKEGLERNLEPARKRAGAHGSILEQYTRCVKTLIAAPQAENDPADHVFGFPLEIVADTNPYRRNDLHLHLLYRGQPLVGALVVAFNKADPLTKLKARTDDAGRVEFTLLRPGAWLVTSVHQVPASFFSRADWESFWASLSFELPSRR